MFMNMIRSTIPRSLRAGVALVVSLIFLQQALTALQSLVLPGSSSGGGTVKGVFCLIIGTVAGVMFYYFQSVDGQTKSSFNELETLNKYQEAQRREEALKKPATPVFSSHDGEIKPKPTADEKAPIEKP